MLTCCAEERAPEQCLVHVITQGECRLGNDMLALFFFSEEGCTPCDSMSFPEHFWRLFCRLAVRDVANAKKPDRKEEVEMMDI